MRVLLQWPVKDLMTERNKEKAEEYREKETEAKREKKKDGLKK
jgi:hypothetical protein